MKKELFTQIMWIIAMIIPFLAAVLFNPHWLWLYAGLAVYRFLDE